MPDNGRTQMIFMRQCFTQSHGRADKRPTHRVQLTHVHRTETNVLAREPTQTPLDFQHQIFINGVNGRGRATRTTHPIIGQPQLLAGLQLDTASEANQLRSKTILANIAPVRLPTLFSDRPRANIAMRPDGRIARFTKKLFILNIRHTRAHRPTASLTMRRAKRAILFITQSIYYKPKASAITPVHFFTSYLNELDSIFNSQFNTELSGRRMISAPLLRLLSLELLDPRMVHRQNQREDRQHERATRHGHHDLFERRQRPRIPLLIFERLDRIPDQRETHDDRTDHYRQNQQQ